MENRIKNVNTHFWVSPETHETVQRIAQAEGRTISAVYRDLVEKGLVAGGYRSGSQDLTAMIRDAVQESLRPQVDRLAAISAKGTQIGAAAFFLAMYNGKLSTPDYLQTEYEDIALQSRKLGVEYLKLAKDKSIDEYIARAFHRLGDERD